MGVPERDKGRANCLPTEGTADEAARRLLFGNPWIGSKDRTAARRPPPSSQQNDREMCMIAKCSRVRRGLHPILPGRRRLRGLYADTRRQLLNRLQKGQQ